MRNDSTNIFALVAGFISGSIICNYFNTAHAYASEEDDPTKDPNLTPAQRAYAKMMIEKNARQQGVTPDELIHQQPTKPGELQSRFYCRFSTLPNGRKIKVCKENPLSEEESAGFDLIPRLDNHGRPARGGDPLHPYQIAPPGSVVGLQYPMETNQTLRVAPAGIKAYDDAASTYARAYASDVLADCDKPKPWNAKEKKRYSLMLPEAQAKYLVDREKEFKRLCKEAAREINKQALEQADPEQTNLKYNVFPNADEDPDAKIIFPTRPNKIISSDVNKAAYAHAYKVTIA